MTLWKNIRFTSGLLGLVSAALFALLYLSGILGPLEDRLYDFFLRLRADRARIDSVVFLDVDDPAIAYNGIYPWPRSIPADSLLRLKEHGARAAIFDIEYIDRGPQGVDSLYLEQGLPADFESTFVGIGEAVNDLFTSLQAGRISRADYDHYSRSLSGYINREHTELFAKAQGIARDNDLYLAQALELFGRSWLTLNLRADFLEGEQSQRRPIAEANFSYPVNAAADAFRGPFIDILPAFPPFAYAAAGAGFTNVEIDKDGIRRRVYLTQNIYNHWYLQLAFAPLINYLGKPDITLEKNKLTIKQAELPDGRKKDIVIPLDSGGRMMLDWPKEDYNKSYKHISFAEFSRLDKIDADIEQYARALAGADILFFANFDPSLIRAPLILSDIEKLFDASRLAKARAMEYISDDFFEEYVEYRGHIRALLAEFITFETGTKVHSLLRYLIEEYPESAEVIAEMVEYIETLSDYLAVSFESENEIREKIDREVRDKFCILGRSDTGTTDMGANPFWGEYINVGTHAVVLDTILSESFITFLGRFWQILFIMALVPIFFLATSRLSPTPRAASGFIAVALIIVAAALTFRFSGFFLGPLGITFALISAAIVREIISYAVSEQEKRFLHTAFSTYVSGDVVQEIIANPSLLNLGGTKRHMTAIFTDVKGFSTISEKLEPEDLVSLLNRYLSAMSDVILDQKGTIDKYEGDAIIAFFGAPLDLSDHALRACVSAITMRKLEEELNRTIIEEQLSPFPLLTRFGINTGSMVAGNMGTQNKMNYTIMGNAVNLAARLEGVNKQYGTRILASQDTVKETGNVLLARKLDRVRVVGIYEPVRLYELVDTMENACEKDLKITTVFNEALDLFEQRKWQQAEKGFIEVLAIKADDGPANIYLERTQRYIETPPPDNWDGVYNLTEK